MLGGADWRGEEEFAEVSGFLSPTYRPKTSEKWHCSYSDNMKSVSYPM
jgi:hypothetical protein